jgi:hypothetical protein
LEVVQFFLGLPLPLPDWTTGRLWLLRLGYYKLMRPKEQAADWVWFIDHSCQVGSQKCLVILGLRLQDLPPPGECIGLEHLEPLEVLPVSSSTQADVDRQLEAVVSRTGVPQAIVRDDGGDLRGGVEHFRVRHPETRDVYDIKHKVACLLRGLLEAEPQWGEFGRQVGTTRCQVQQTEMAFLAPPSQRPKARYMNVAELVGWGQDTLRLLEQKPTQVLQQVSAERLEAKLGWLREYREALATWSEVMAIATTAEDFMRRQGLYVGVAVALAKQLPAATSRAGRQMRVALLRHVGKQARQVRVGERLPASTEALESCFGRLKHLEKEQSRSGFTGLLLGVGALVAETTAAVVQAALECCPVKKVWRWCREKLGATVQAQRRAAYAADPAQ